MQNNQSCRDPQAQRIPTIFGPQLENSVSQKETAARAVIGGENGVVWRSGPWRGPAAIERPWPSTYTYRKPEFDCKLRTTMAQFFSSPADIPWSEAVRALSELCLQSDSVHRKNLEHPEDGSATDCSRIEIQGGNQCPFCLADDSLRMSDKQHSFHSKGTLRTHVHRKHHAFTTSSLPVFCPYSECGAKLDHGDHLKNHLTAVRTLML